MEIAGIKVKALLIASFLLYIPFLIFWLRSLFQILIIDNLLLNWIVAIGTIFGPPVGLFLSSVAIVGSYYNQGSTSREKIISLIATTLGLVSTLVVLWFGLLQRVFLFFGFP